MSSKGSKRLYENRFCNQEDFDIIISENHNDLPNTEVRTTSRLSYPEFNEIETLYCSSNYRISKRTIGERSNIWNICSKKNSQKLNKTDVFIDSFSIYLDKKCSVDQTGSVT